MAGQPVWTRDTGLLPGDVDLLAELAVEHQALRGAADDLRAVVTEPVGAERFLALVAVLARTTSLEQAVLHPTVRRVVPDGDALADVRCHDIGRLEARAAAADRAEPGSPAFVVAAEGLVRDISAHVDHGERWLVPALVRNLEDEELADLGERYVSLRSLTPSTDGRAQAGGPAEDLSVTPVAAAFGRVRSALRRC